MDYQNVSRLMFDVSIPEFVHDMTVMPSQSVFNRMSDGQQSEFVPVTHITDEDGFQAMLRILREYNPQAITLSDFKEISNVPHRRSLVIGNNQIVVITSYEEEDVEAFMDDEVPPVIDEDDDREENDWDVDLDPELTEEERLESVCDGEESDAAEDDAPYPIVALCTGAGVFVLNDTLLVWTNGPNVFFMDLEDVDPVADMAATAVECSDDGVICVIPEQFRIDFEGDVLWVAADTMQLAVAKAEDGVATFTMENGVLITVEVGHHVEAD